LIFTLNEKEPSHRCKHICKPHKPKHRPKLAKELPPFHPDKIELKKISSPSENKKYATAQPNDRQKSVAMQTPKPLTGKAFQLLGGQKASL
jgi:hypothetical protein